jgi:hypothetical protein
MGIVIVVFEARVRPDQLELVSTRPMDSYR